MFRRGIFTPFLAALALIACLVVTLTGCDKKVSKTAQLAIGTGAAMSQDMRASYEVIKDKLQPANPADQADFDRFKAAHGKGLEKQAQTYAELSARMQVGTHLSDAMITQLQNMAETSAVRAANFKLLRGYANAKDSAVAEWLDAHLAALQKQAEVSKQLADATKPAAKAATAPPAEK